MFPPALYRPRVSFAQVLEELPALTVEQRHLLVRKALELDDAPLSAAAEALVEARLAAHHANPSSSVPLGEMKRRIRSRARA